MKVSEARSTELSIRKAGESVAKEWPFFVQRMGSTSNWPLLAKRLDPYLVEAGVKPVVFWF
jgi:hypothetical protein